MNRSEYSPKAPVVPCNGIFETMGLIFNPKPSTPPESVTRKQRIISIEDFRMIDKIYLLLEITWHPTGNDATKTEMIEIDHDHFNQWLDENERLQEEGGPIDDPRIYSIDYATYLIMHVNKHDYIDYINENQLIPDNLTWDL